MMRAITIGLLMLAQPVPGLAQSRNYAPVFADIGRAVPVPDADFLPTDSMVLKHSYDMAEKAPDGAVHPALQSAARFMNMTVGNGMAANRVKVAVVVHGPASVDLTNAAFYAGKREGKTNPNVAAIAALTKAGVQIILCGQAAAGHGIEKSDLLPGVKLSWAASTAHAILQADGYSLNPF
ncbi:DsrE family protein [Sphingobium algorifonticola]|nr:DsrE family protein [Sphingobium algorifonticola]